MATAPLPPNWPWRASARQIRARPHDWCVIDHGTGRKLLFLHGAGASGHSFRHLIPALPGWRAIVPDLPGQGFTRAGSRSPGVPHMRCATRWIHTACSPG